MERLEYDRMAAAEDTMWWYRALHERLIELLAGLRLSPGASVLDAGCGTGGLLRRIGERAPSLERVGLELDAGAADIARRKSQSEIVVGTVNDLPFPSESFDVVVSADVICHANVDESAALAEFRRCLRPGGSLLLNLPAYQWLLSDHDARVQNVRRYTARGARDVVERAGLRTRGAGYWNSLLLPLMVVHRTLSRGRGSSDVRSFPAWQDGLFSAVAAGECRLRRLGLRLPFGGSVWLWAVKP